jgi:hypothetical protein
MEKILSIIFICCLTLLSAAQSFSPFIFQLGRTNQWNAIKIYNDSLYFSIENNILSEGFSNRILKLSKDLKNGKVIKNMPYSGSGKLINISSNLIWFNGSQDYKNTRNGHFTIFNKNAGAIGPVIIGDTSNDVYNLIEMDNSLILSGNYRPPTSQFGLSGFLARYNLSGQKIWEKYYRMNRNGFKTTSFDYVFHTKNNELLVIGSSEKDSAGIWQTQIITALFDTSGNLLELKIELDSLGRQFDDVFNLFRLPRLYLHSCIQLTDSTFALLLLNNESQLNFSPRWLFFNDKGNVVHSRKAWMYRDTVNNPLMINSSFGGLVKRKYSDEFLAHHYFYDSIDKQRMVVFDNELYLKKVFPGIASYDRPNSHAGLCAFVEDEDKNFYQLRFLAIDSITELDYFGSLVCKVDSNGQLLSNGSLFPVGMADLPNAQDILLYPNPTREVLSISFGLNQHISLEMYNTHGQLLRSETFLGEHQINMSEFTHGLYLFKFTDTKGGSFTRKVIRE